LQIFQATENLVVDLEDDFGVETGAFLDGEWAVFQLGEGSGGGQLDGDVGTPWGLEGQGVDDALSRVVGVADRLASVETQRGLPSIEGLIILIWTRVVASS
jgi:hypothetical protein